MLDFDGFGDFPHRNFRFDLRYRFAADHDLLFRARRQQARFFNCDELIAILVKSITTAKRNAASAEQGMFRA